MKYQNPIIPGFYPDPSICCKDKEYYLVNSSFEYFPGVPIFKSNDMINWTQIGNCLTRKSQLMIDGCPCSGGVFAPTIRFYNGYFYMITTIYTKSGLQNFYIYTENPEMEWSDPILVDIEGIDPSFYWEDGRTYIQYAGILEHSTVIKQVEIKLESGEIIDGSRVISKGCGGRDVEGPHMWKRNNWYYLMLAEGGTREGHMVTLMRSKEIWGPFEACPYNPILSNRDRGKEPLQSIGHADWIEDANGKSWLVALGTRHKKHKTLLGRETMLTPAYWTEDGWLLARDGYMPLEIEVDTTATKQKEKAFVLDFKQGNLPEQIISPRYRNDKLIKFSENAMIITGNGYTLDELADPVFLAIRQSQYEFELKTKIQFFPEKEEEESGIAMFMDNEHYISFFITIREKKRVIILRKKIDEIVDETIYPMTSESNEVFLGIHGSDSKYEFFASDKNEIFAKGWALTKHITSECSNSVFTGVVGGIFITGNKPAHVTEFAYYPGDSPVE